VFGLRLDPAYSERAGHRQSEIGITGIAAFIGGAAILSVVMLPGFFQGKSTDAAKPQAVADSSVHADRTAVVAPLQGTNKSNPPGDTRSRRSYCTGTGQVLNVRFGGKADIARCT
jgi:hypothetical protein